MTFRAVRRGLIAALIMVAPVHAEDFDKNKPEAALVRGGIVFNTYCVLCHGASGEGNGRAAKIYTPRPANLVMSPHNDEYKELIVRRGGAGVGRSAFMPPWGDQLTDEQVHDLIQYLRAINTRKS